MTRTDLRALVGGVGLLAAGMLLTEILVFRLLVATLSLGFALFVAVLTPAMAALGAVLFGRRKGDASGPELGQAAAHMAGVAGAFAALGAIGLTWSSQAIAILRGHGDITHAAVALTAALSPSLFGGAAMALAMRRGAKVVGRLGFAEGLGGALLCLLLPFAMTFGAPRLALAVGFFYAAAAFCFAYLGRSAQVRWAMMATLPLALTSLLAGDIGDQWMKIRLDHGRRTEIDYETWSPLGVVSVEDRSKQVKLDRNTPVLLPDAKLGARKPKAAAQDFVFLIHEGRKDKGKVLVIGSGAGREVQAALAYEHPRVDDVELHPGFVNDVLGDAYADKHGFLLTDERIGWHLGDGRKLDALANDYHHVLVLDYSTVTQSPPRLVAEPQRLFTTEAIAGYLARLRADGALTLRLPHEGMETVIASAAEAIGGPPPLARERMIACSGNAKAILVVLPEKPSATLTQKLTRGCRKARLTVELPLEQPRRRRNREVLLTKLEERRHALETAVATSDDKPFFVPLPEDWPAAVDESVRALVPQPVEPPPDGSPRPEMSIPGIAAAALAAAAVVFLLALLVPAPKQRRSVPLALGLSMPLFGAAVSLCLFSLGDHLLRGLGHGVGGWVLIIPLGLVSLGAGRLWVDAVASASLRRHALVACGLGLVVLVGVHLMLATVSSQLWLGLGICVLSGLALGQPLAIGLRLAAEWDEAAVAALWSRHAAGFALGAAFCQLFVLIAGVAKLWPVGVAAFALGAALLALGSLRRAPVV